MAKVTDTQRQIQAQREFVEGYLDENNARVYPSVAQAGKRNGISRSAVYRLAKEQKWQEQRNRLLQEVNQKHNEQRADTLADERTLLDKRCTQLVEAALAQIAAAFTDAQKKRSVNPDYVMPESQLEALMRALTNAQKIGKLALGEAQEIQKVAADVAIPESFRQIVQELDELAGQKASYGSHTLQ